MKFNSIASLTSALCLAATWAVGTAEAAGIPGQGTWQSTLQGRDLDGNLANGHEAYYDTALDITWLADTRFSLTSGFTAGGNGSAGYWDNGNMTWAKAVSWAAQVVVNGYGGWRLPNMVDTGAPGCAGNDFAANGTDCGYNVDTSKSELAHMYYVTLGNKAAVTPGGAAQTGYGMTNTGPFVVSNLGTPGNSATATTWGFWTGTQDLSPSSYGTLAFGLATYYGEQRTLNKTESGVGVWLVHNGDVAAVPEPAAMALFIAGLGCLAVLGPRRSQARRHRSATPSQTA